MEEKKNNKGLVWLIVVLIILVLGLVGYIVYDKLTLSNKENKKNTTTVENSELNTNSSDENPNYAKKDIVLDFETVKENGYMEIGNELLNKYTDGKYTINLLIDNIKVNGKRHSVKIENFEPNDYDCIKGKDKVVYFDNEVIYEPEGEGCYLSGLEDILVYQNKYVIIVFMYQNGGWIDVFDEDGKRLKTNIDMTVSSIEQINENNITIIGWPDNNEELSCKDNEYELKIEDGIINYSLINVGTNENCI